MEMGKHCILVATSNMVEAQYHLAIIRKCLLDELNINAVYRNDEPTMLETPNCVVRFVWPDVKYILNGIRPDAIFGFRWYIDALDLKELYPRAEYPTSDYGTGLLTYIETIERGRNDMLSPRAIFEKIVKESNYMASKSHNVTPLSKMSSSITPLPLSSLSDMDRGVSDET